MSERRVIAFCAAAGGSILAAVGMAWVSAKRDSGRTARGAGAVRSERPAHLENLGLELQCC